MRRFLKWATRKRPSPNRINQDTVKRLDKKFSGFAFALFLACICRPGCADEPANIMPLNRKNGWPAKRPTHEHAAKPKPNPFPPERVAPLQIMLERMHFSGGAIDGFIGSRTSRALRDFQAYYNLPITGQFDDVTLAQIGEPTNPLTSYEVTADDMARILPTPKTWLAKSKATYLGYNDAWEMLAEKFHCYQDYLHSLNPTLQVIQPGVTLVVPNLEPATPLPACDFLLISLSESCIRAMNKEGRAMSHFPCSIAANKNKLPSGELSVIVIAPSPNYTFDPVPMADTIKGEDIRGKLVIPPGPNNPVGVAWIGLNLPGYGMHGTPEPEQISVTQSHGCFRLANWDAESLLKLCRIGMKVVVEP